MMTSGEFGNPLRKFKLVFLGEQSGKFKQYFLSSVYGNLSHTSLITHRELIGHSLYVLFVLNYNIIMINIHFYTKQNNKFTNKQTTYKIIRMLLVADAVVK